jgi:TRAP-type C4-dicarboxylate transport system substrate-binding protein
MKLPRLICALFVASAVFALLTQPLTAADAEWKFYTYFAANDKPTALHRAFAEDVTKATGGRLKITVYSSGELPYKASDVLRTVASNQVEIGDVALGFVAGDVPELNAFAMPFACTSIDKFYDKAIPAVSKSVDSVLSQRFKTASVMHWTMPPQQLWLVKGVDNLDGLKGLKVRSWNREQAEVMRLVGGSGVTINPAEVIPSLQRRVVDGAFTAAVPALDWKINEVAAFGYLLNLTLSHQAVAVNEAALAKLPDDVRKVFLDKAREWAPKYRSEMIAADAAARKTLVERGMTLREATPAEIEKLRALTRPIWDDWATKTPAGTPMLDAVATACS